MNLTPQQLELLNKLEDIQLPDPIGWWPLSSAWWMIIFMLATVLVALVWYYFDQKKRNAYRQEALERLAELTAIPMTESNPNQQILAINTLLKQVALTAYARHDVAKLNDQAWLDFLTKRARHIRATKPSVATVQLAYQKPSELAEQQTLDLQALNLFKNYATQWIKGHHQ